MRQWDERLSECLNGTRKVTDEAIDRAEAALVDFEHSRAVERAYVRAGIRDDLKRITKAENRVLVSYNGRSVSKAAMLGVQRLADDGTYYYQTEALHVTTWADLERWRRSRVSQINEERINVHMADVLLRLREQFPESAGPAEACERLGVTLEDFLAEAAS